MRREPRQDRSRATVERIVAAARTVLVERGYEGASTNRIAAAAGVGPGTLYQYFPDKGAIVDRVVTEVVDDLEARILRTFLASLRPGHDTVRVNLEALLDALAARAVLIRCVAEHSPQAFGSQRAGFAQRVDQLVAGVLLTRHGEDDGVPVGTVAWMLVRTVEHVTLAWVLEGGTEGGGAPREELLDELDAMITGYLDRLGHGRADGMERATGIEPA